MSEHYEAPPEWLDKTLVLAFFWRFSVFECALKREGFLRKGRNDTAEPNWPAFEKKIAGGFAGQSSEAFHAARQFLLEHPPRRQVVRNERLAWQPVGRKKEDSDEAFLLRLVKTVRNNLFHGGKYPGVAIDEIARDRQLLQAALTVLEVCFKLHPGIARHGAEAA